MERTLQLRRAIPYDEIQFILRAIQSGGVTGGEEFRRALEQRLGKPIGPCPRGRPPGRPQRVPVGYL